MFVLNSNIRIGTLQFTGVHDVKIKRSLHGIGDSATITVPSIAKISSGQRAGSQNIAIGLLIAEGDQVVIALGYNGWMVTEFVGFVKRIGLQMPCVIECEGYQRVLRLGMALTGYYTTSSVAELLGLIATASKNVPNNGIIDVNANTEITVKCTVDIPLSQIRLEEIGGDELVSRIKQLCQGAIDICWIDYNKLWCGLTYTPYSKNNDPFGLGQVNYRLGWNCIKDNGLKERQGTEKVQVIYGGTLATGQRLLTQSNEASAAKKVKAIFNNIPSVTAMQTMANETQYRKNYAGYEGHVTGFLQPYCAPGYMVNIVDDRYPVRNGVYMCETTEVTYGVRGARRIVELGPRLGFTT